MTNSEALRAIGEMIDTNETEDKDRKHYLDVVDKILTDEEDKSETD